MIDIILLCRNRPGYAEEALISLCKINFSSYNITISDNSSSPLFGNRDFASEFPHIKINYIYRRPNLDASDHFTQAILESTSEFICLFHDDDIALPDFIENRMEFFEDKNTVAVGTNAYHLVNQIKKNKTLLAYKKALKIESPHELLSHYFSLNYGNVAPFPGYIYRRKVILKTIGALKSCAKKYSDVVLLLELLKHGSIVWAPNPSMYYRRHSNNDSNFENINDRLGLLRIIKDTNNIKPKIIDSYRFFFYIKWLPKTIYFKNRIRSFHHYRLPIRKFLLLFLVKNIYSLILRLLRKIK
jgi:hypothetical protein